MTVAQVEFQSDAVETMLDCLFLVDVTLVTASESDHSSSEKIAAIYRNDDGKIAAVCRSDFEFAARAGAALTMFPCGGCDDAIAAQELDENYIDNFNEVMNLLATLISASNGKRIFLSELLTPGQAMPEDASALIDGHRICLTFKATFARYGDGVFSFYG